MISCRVSTSMQQGHRPVFRWSRRITGENSFEIYVFRSQLWGKDEQRGKSQTNSLGQLSYLSERLLCDAGRRHRQCLLHRSLLFYTPDPARFTSSVNPEERGQELNSKQVTSEDENTPTDEEFPQKLFSVSASSIHSSAL